MNYLVQTKEGNYIVLSKVTKDWTNYIGKDIYISTGTTFFRVIQEIEIR